VSRFCRRPASAFALVTISRGGNGLQEGGDDVAVGMGLDHWRYVSDVLECAACGNAEQVIGLCQTQKPFGGHYFYRASQKALEIPLKKRGWMLLCSVEPDLAHRTALMCMHVSSYYI
jgi:hypothetical protein